eukprot:jgi/Chlat1/1866/Chrsp141S02193
MVQAATTNFTVAMRAAGQKQWLPTQQDQNKAYGSEALRKVAKPLSYSSDTSWPAAAEAGAPLSIIAKLPLKASSNNGVNDSNRRHLYGRFNVTYFVKSFERFQAAYPMAELNRSMLETLLEDTYMQCVLGHVVERSCPAAWHPSPLQAIGVP